MNRLPVGIQVYGLRDLLENTPDNFKNVMQQIKDMGYDGVELAGLYGINPADVKRILDEVGLIPISAHVPLVEMMEDPKKAELYMQIFCKKSDTARQYVNRWLPIVAAAQLTKKKEKEKELLLRWIDVAEYQ